MGGITLRDLPVSSFGLAHVRWLDAAAYSGWFGINDTIQIEPLEIETIGWLVYRDSAAIVLAASACDYKIGDLLVIPARSVVSVNIVPSPPAQEEEP